MKITRVSSTVVNANMRNWVFVKVETDQDGLYGWGEATLEWKTAGVVGSVEDISRLVIGEDPMRIEHLYQVMNRHAFFRAGVVGMSALSGIEQACWDIFGKSLGVPVYQLLGGNVRDYIRMYDHLGGGEMNALYLQDQWTLNRFTLSGAGDLVNISANRCVDIANVNPANGAVLHLWDCVGGANQKWRRV